MHRVVVCVLVLLLSSAAAAQVPGPDSTPTSEPSQVRLELTGRVVDATGGPVTHAQVTVQRAAAASTPVTILTDGHGTFRLTVAPGSYSVVVNADGFVSATERIDVIAGTTPNLEVVLRVAGFSEIVNVDAPAIDATAAIVSAMKTPTLLRDVPQSVSIVGRELIADQRMSSMADVVRFMPGVSMAQGEGNRDTPIFRGNSSTSDFFVDGVRDDVQYFRDVYNVERVEALKGPNAMIFGRGGAGGVLNRVTRQANWQEERELSAQIGSWDNRRVTADFGTALNDAVAARVTGVFEDSDSYRDGVGLERYGVQPSVAFRLGSSTVLRGSYEHFHDERVADRGIPSFNGRPVATEAATFFGDPDNSLSDATVDLFASVLEHDFNGTVMLRNRVSYGVYDKFYQNVFPGAVDAAGAMVTISAYNNATDRKNLFNQTDVVIRTQTGRIGHTILAGAEFGRQVTDNVRNTGYFAATGTNSIQVPLSSPTISVPVTFRQSATDADNHGVATVAAFYAQDQITLSSQWQAVAGVRFDAFDMDFTNNRTGQNLTSQDRLVSPRLGLIYKPVLPVSLYGSYSLTYVPRAGDQLSSLSLTNQSLEPETFRNYEVGMKWDATRALGLTAALYRLDRGNVAVTDPADPTRSILVDAQRTTGVEFQLTGEITPDFSLIAGYTWQDGEITRSISANAGAGATLAQVPDHAFSFWGRYVVTPRWSAALGVIHRTEVFTSTDNLVVLPGFTRVDGGIFFDVTPKVRAQLNLENLFDEDYFANAHSNNNITPGAPRAIRFAVTTKF
jgi:catecholate siderophore receptor